MGLFSSTLRKNVRKAAAQVIETLESRTMMSNTWYVANDGNDDARGNARNPLATIQAAVDRARRNDTIMVSGGDYAGGITINKAGLRIIGEGDVRISAPIDDESVQTSIRITENANNVLLKNLDISGGYYYALKTDSTWDTGDSDPRGPSGLRIRNSRLHDSGRDVIKFTPKTDYSRIINCEIYNSGRRDPSNAEGIDAVQANYAILRRSYIHDTTTNGIYYKGGSVGTLIERNRIENTGHSGILIGQSSDENWFDTSVNPDYYESIDSIVRNNTVTNTQGAGIGAWAALRPQVYGNVLDNVAQSMFAGLLIQGQEHWPNGESVIVPSTDVSMHDNVVSVAGDRPAFEIREGGLTGSLYLANNTYWSDAGRPTFEDDRSGFSGGIKAWRRQTGESGSRVADID